MNWPKFKEQRVFRLRLSDENYVTAQYVGNDDNPDQFTYKNKENTLQTTSLADFVRLYEAGSPKKAVEVETAEGKWVKLGNKALQLVQKPSTRKKIPKDVVREKTLKQRERELDLKDSYLSSIIFEQTTKIAEQAAKIELLKKLNSELGKKMHEYRSQLVEAGLKRQ